MIDIHLADVVAASLAAAGACLACSIPADFLRRFPHWAIGTYGRRALLVPFLIMMVGTWLVRLGMAGQIESPAGQAMVVAAFCLVLVLANALVRFYLNEYRKP